MIDVAFVLVRPSPWRRRSPGNMMLVLAVAPTGNGYRRALRYFTRPNRLSVRPPPRGGEPEPSSRVHEAGPRGRAGHVPRPGPAAQADRAAALEHPPGRPGVAILGSTAIAVVVSGPSFPPTRTWANPPRCGTGTRILAVRRSVGRRRLTLRLRSRRAGRPAAPISSVGSQFSLNSDPTGNPAVTSPSPQSANSRAHRQAPPTRGHGRLDRRSARGTVRGLRFYTFPGAAEISVRLRARRVPADGGRRPREVAFMAPGHPGQLRRDKESLARAGGRAACQGKRPEGHECAAPGAGPGTSPQTVLALTQWCWRSQRHCRRGRRPRPAGPHPAPDDAWPEAEILRRSAPGNGGAKVLSARFVDVTLPVGSPLTGIHRPAPKVVRRGAFGPGP